MCASIHIYICIIGVNSSSFSYSFPEPEKNHGARKTKSYTWRSERIFYLIILIISQITQVRFGYFEIYHTHILSMFKKIITVIIDIKSFLGKYTILFSCNDISWHILTFSLFPRSICHFEGFWHPKIKFIDQIGLSLFISDLF